jgi:hypothetical protein
MGVLLGVTLRANVLQITPEILNLIAELDEFKGAWQAFGTLAPERLSALRRVATIESVGSSTRIRSWSPRSSRLFFSKSIHSETAMDG